MRIEPRVRMNLPTALAVAVLIHVLLMLGSGVIPGLRAAWNPRVPEPPPEPDPIQFTFVDLAQEPPEPETPPEDAVASDRTRSARQERPPDTVPESPDPFSRGNTEQRMSSQPSPQVSPERQGPAADAAEAAQAAPRGVEPVPGGEFFPAAEAGEEAGDGETVAAEETQRKLQSLRDITSRPLSPGDLDQRFENLGKAAVTAFGPISFDTVGIDWGPYARAITEIIRQRWYERIPQAARLGLKGRSVIRFRIALDGGVSGIQLVDGSGHRPLDKAAEFAIEASDLPPLPAAFLELDASREDVGVTFQFYYNMPVPRR